jgi:ABC-type glycerol-3-phosphate transport system substrate-binding protein
MVSRQALIRLLFPCLFILSLVTACRAEVQPSVPENSLDEDVIITFAGWESDRQSYEMLIDAFHEEHPNITIQFVPVPSYVVQNITDSDLYYRQLASAGDVIILPSVPPAHVLHYFQDLQSLLEADSAFGASDYWPGALGACQSNNGHLWGIPMNIHFQGIFYDENAFQIEDLPLPQPGWTWDDFQTAVTTLANSDNQIIRYGFAESTSSLLSSVIAATVEDAQGEIEVDAIQSQIDWYIELLNADAIYLHSDEQTQNADALETWQSSFHPDSHPAMWTGSLAEALPWAEQSTEIDLLSNAAFKTLGFVPYPVANDGVGEATSLAWAECATISAGSQHPYQAWMWVNFLSHRRLEGHRNDAGDITKAPARISVTEASNYWDNFPDNLEASIRYILQHAWYGTQYPEVLTIIYEALSIVATGQGDFVTALNQIKVQAEAIPQPTPDFSPIVVATPKPTHPVGIVEINYFYSADDEEQQAITTLIETYNQNQSGIRVILTTDFDLPANTDRLTELSKNFDCFTSIPFNWETQNLANLLSLNTFLDAEGDQFIQEFDHVIMDVFDVQDEVYGLPAFNNIPVISFNADLLARRGLSTPENDWDFGDFIEMMSMATSTKQRDRSYGFLYNPYDDLLLAGHGSVWADFNTDPPVPMLQSPEFVNTLDWLDNLNKSGALLVQQDYEASQQAILAGQVAFWLTVLEDPGDWFMGQSPGYQVGIAPLPTIEGSYQMLNWGVQGHFISGMAQKPELCWDWIKFLSEQPTVFKGIPARTSVNHSPEWEALVGGENAIIYRSTLLNATRTYKNSRFTPIAWPIYIWQKQAITTMLQGQDYRAQLPELQKKADDYIHCMELITYDDLMDHQLNAEIQRCVMQADPDSFE